VTAGERLRERILTELQESELELDGREAEHLDQACTTADTIAALEAVIASEGPTTTGSRGQTVVHPAIAEIRMHKLVLARLLAGIELGTDDAVKSAKARRSAGTRWGK
jgi:hypothetical protein